jgi:hypothetical protein
MYILYLCIFLHAVHDQNGSLDISGTQKFRHIYDRVASMKINERLIESVFIIRRNITDLSMLFTDIHMYPNTVLNFIVEI